MALLSLVSVTVLTVTLCLSDQVLVTLPGDVHLPLFQQQIVLIASRSVVTMCVAYVMWCCLLPNNECPVYWRWLRALLSNRYLFTGAAVSYPAYLWHWLVLIILAGYGSLGLSDGVPVINDRFNLHLLDLQYTSVFLAVSVLFLLVSVITFFLGALSYVFVEKPFLSLRP